MLRRPTVGRTRYRNLTFCPSWKYASLCPPLALCLVIALYPHESPASVLYLCFHQFRGLTATSPHTISSTREIFGSILFWTRTSPDFRRDLPIATPHLSRQDLSYWLIAEWVRLRELQIMRTGKARGNHFVLPGRMANLWLSWNEIRSRCQLAWAYTLAPVFVYLKSGHFISG